MPTFGLCSAFMWFPLHCRGCRGGHFPTHFLGRVHQALVAAELGSSKSPPCLVIMVATRVFSALPSPEPLHKMAATLEPLHFMAAVPGSHPVMAVVPESHPVMAVVPESRPKIAASPESLPKMAPSPEPLNKMATTPERPAVMDVK